MKLSNLTSRVLTSFVLLILTFLIWIYDSLFYFTLILAGVFSIIEFFELNNKIFKKKKLIFIFNIIFIFYIFLFCSLALIFTFNIYLKILLFVLILTCVSSDIGGFVVGKIFKGPKISKISPNKTVSGAIGSIIFSCISFTFLIYLKVNNFNFSYIFIASCTSIGCQIGDLFFSLLKRKAKIKDTGKFLPGHGGVLDRLDGMLLGIPTGFIIISFYY